MGDTFFILSPIVNSYIIYFLIIILYYDPEGDAFETETKVSDCTVDVSTGV